MITVIQVAATQFVQRDGTTDAKAHAARRKVRRGWCISLMDGFLPTSPGSALVDTALAS